MAKIASGASQGTPAVRGSATHGADPEAAAGASRPRGLRRPPLDEQLLLHAAELVARGWCREAPAEDMLGREVDPWSGAARRWTPLGALVRAWCDTGGDRIEAFTTAYLALALAVGGTVSDWNAEPWRTKEDATAALERAREHLPSARDYERTLRRDHERRAERAEAF